jgi:hypothetical protein
VRKAGALLGMGWSIALRRAMMVRMRRLGRCGLVRMAGDTIVYCAGVRPRQLEECRGKPQAPESGYEANQSGPAHGHEYDEPDRSSQYWPKLSRQ